MQSAFNSSVFDKVALAVKQAVYIEVPGLSGATRLVDDLALGRLGRLKLAIRLEEVFNIEFQDDVVERFGTLGFTEEALQERGILGQGPRQDLERDHAPGLLMDRVKDVAHPA